MRYLIADGKLPSNTVCPLSGGDANHVVYFRVECERPWLRRGTDDGWQRIVLILFGGIGFFMPQIRTRPSEVVGHEVAVEVPLRIHARESMSLQRMRQRDLRTLLARIPAYRQLLREYPKANIEALEAAA